jgi:hypothetical protein
MRRARIAVIAMVLATAFVGLTAGTATAQKAGGSGAGTKAALANPDCDPDTGRIRFPSLAAPLCVKEWKDGADNGGATAQGVTKDTIEVAVLYADVKVDDRTPATLFRNQATGGFSNMRDTIVDTSKIYEHAYETWGRDVEFTFVLGTGPDEAAQRADAATIAALKPFAVLDAGFGGGNQKVGGLVFENTLQQRGVPIVISSGGGIPQSPKEASRGIAANAAEFAGKALVGKKAEYGGDAVTDQERVFGILYQGGSNGFDIDFFKKEFAKYGGKIASEAAFDYDPAAAAAEVTALAQSQTPPLIAKMKEAGVTTVINVLDARYGMRPAMAAATQQEFFPEWVMASGGPNGGGAFPGDLPILVRTADAQQMAHTFGLVYLPPYVAQQTSANPFQWFWGSDKGNTWSGAQAMLGSLYSRIHLAGPALTAAKMKPGALPSKPAGGQFSDAVLTPAAGTNKDGTPIYDTTIAWWSGDTVGFDPATRAEGEGVYMYLDGAKRYNPGSFPKNVKGLFDESLSTTVHGFETRPPGEPTAPDYPCEGCPSSGSATPAQSNLGAT